MARVPRSLRLSLDGLAAVQAVADRDGLTWNEAARRLLAFALRPGGAMPPGWHPGRDR